MKIFQLLDLIIKLFRLNNKSKVVLLFLIPTFLLGQNQAFWLGKRPTAVSGAFNVDFLVVAGGGGTGPFSGGAGAGGYRSSYGAVTGGGLPAENPIIANVGDVFTVTVGLGAPANQANPPAPGGNSVFSSITSLGGGSVNPAATSIGNGSSGGSGAGARMGSGTSFTGGAGTAGQGYNGGSNGTSVNYGGGGGGGAGQAGGNGTTTTGGKGGDGVQNSITGTAIYYAGGGGAGTFQGGTAGLGGLGGGGNAGAAGGNNAGSPGTDGLGGGAGSGSYQTSAGSGAKGGNGVVIIRFDDAYDIITTSGNLVLEKSIVGTDRVVKFTSGSGTIEFVENPIVTENLVAYYDFSLPNSYPGTGTVLSDISGNNGQAATLVNGPTYLPEAGGVLYLNGGDDYISWPGTFMQGYTNYTIQWWAKVPSGGDGVSLFEKFASTNDRFVIWLDNRSNQRILSEYQSSAGYTVKIHDFVIDPNKYYNITFSKTGNEIKMYIDGSYVATHVLTSSAGLSGQAMYYGWKSTSGIASATSYASYLGEIQIYNAGLTDAQVLQNFNATKARYSSSGPVWDGTQTSILDDYPTAAAAYSVRALNSNYTGPLMTIRRASDNAEADVYALANGDLDQAWINSFCTGSSCTVKTLYDQSGNGNNCTQTASGSQPLIYTGGSVITQDGKAAFQFDGTDDILITNNNYAYGSVISMISVARIITNKTYSRILSANSDIYAFLGTAGSPFYIASFFGNGTTWGTVAAQSTVTWNQQRLVVSIAESTNYLYIDNSAAITRSNPMGSYTGKFDIGGSSVTPAQSGNSNIQEIIIYPNTQRSNITGIRSNINTYFSIY